MAQAGMPAKFIQMVEIQVKAGSQMQFEAYMKKIVEAANKVNASQGWIAAQAALGTDGTKYYAVLGFNKWAERDSWSQIPEMLMKAFGEAEGQKILKMGGDAYWGFSTKILELDEELSWNLKAYPTAKHYQMMLGQVKPDMADEYRMVISKIKEAQEKTAGASMGIRRTNSVGKSWEFYMARPFDEWSELDGAENNIWQNVAKAHGEAERWRLQKTLQGCYESREFFIIQTRPDLSRQAPAPTSND
jgi:hypothetical protein